MTDRKWKCTSCKAEIVTTSSYPLFACTECGADVEEEGGDIPVFKAKPAPASPSYQELLKWVCAKCGNVAATPWFAKTPAQCPDCSEYDSFDLLYKCPECGWLDIPDAKDIKCENCGHERDEKAIDAALESLADRKIVPPSDFKLLGCMQCLLVCAVPKTSSICPGCGSEHLAVAKVIDWESYEDRFLKAVKKKRGDDEFDEEIKTRLWNECPMCGLWCLEQGDGFDCPGCAGTPTKKTENTRVETKTRRTVFEHLPATFDPWVHSTCQLGFATPAQDDDKPVPPLDCPGCGSSKGRFHETIRAPKGRNWVQCGSCDAVWLELSDSPRYFCPMCRQRLFEKESCKSRESTEEPAMGRNEIEVKAVYSGHRFETREEAEQEKALIEAIRSIVDKVKELDDIDGMHREDESFLDDPYNEDMLAGHIRKELKALLKKNKGGEL